jgi:lysozyme family protein
MAMGPFPAWWAFCQRSDNDGQPLHDEAGDPGGATAWGFTFGTYREHASGLGLNPSYDAFRVMSQAQFMPMARTIYWEGIMGDRMPGAAAILWCDFHFTSEGATACLQKMLGVEEDGVVGTAQTIPAITWHWAANPVALLERMTTARIAYDKGLRLPKFTNGWVRRANDALVVARGLIAA